MTDVPTVDDVKNSATGAVKPGAIAGAGYGLGSALLGKSLGRPAGGVVAGAAVGGDEGDMIALFGIAEGVENMISPSQTTTSGSSRGRM